MFTFMKDKNYANWYVRMYDKLTYNIIYRKTFIESRIEMIVFAIHNPDECERQRAELQVHLLATEAQNRAWQRYARHREDAAQLLQNFRNWQESRLSQAA